MSWSYAHRLCRARGFTLIETLISLGILAMIAGIGLGSGIDSYERELDRFQTTTLLWNVLRTRAEAMHGICEKSSCTTGVSQEVQLDSLHTITFEALSGEVLRPQSIVVKNGGLPEALSVNSEGGISLTP